MLIFQTLPHVLNITTYKCVAYILKNRKKIVFILLTPMPNYGVRSSPDELATTFINSIEIVMIPINNAIRKKSCVTLQQLCSKQPSSQPTVDIFTSSNDRKS